MVLSGEQISSFQEYIFTWWKKNRRDLPWRHTHDPYKILVSELMLQQTQVLRVIPKYAEFIEAFPTIFDLANASVGDVLRMWKGMGYNRRALYLRKLAETIVSEYQGIFPQEEKLLLKLPGLGKYTARAVLVFAFQQDVAMIDTNIRQIIVHHFFKGESPKESVIQEVADVLVPRGRAWDWHQALMDYGSLELKKISNPSPSSKPSILFRESKRFFRGRIIDYLRDKSWSKQSLVKEMIAQYGKDTSFHEQILERLHAEGLIESTKTDIISLPK